MMTIFKAYDIRGIYGKELTEGIVHSIGRAFIDFLKCKKIVLGHDMRLSAEPLAKAFIDGATMQGADVINIGLVSTDALYFASGFMDIPGVMFTASHNPKEYNGIKLCREKASPINYDNGLQFIEKIVTEGKFKPASHKGSVAKREIMQDFVRHVRSFTDFNAISKLKIAVDAGNGMAGRLVPEVFKASNALIMPLYFELDGSFPNHPADPSKRENLKELQKAVTAGKCNMGMAFDGDADRVFFVDENGSIIDASMISCLIIESILKPGEKVIYNLVCSKRVPEIILKNKGIPVRERVGHSYIKETMEKTDAVFGCEHSAHYYYRGNFRADSGIITASIICSILSKSGKTLSELIGAFRKYYKIEESNEVVKDKDAKIKEIIRIYKGRADVSTLDGVTVEFSNWWFNVRPSNTEPLLRLNLEADSLDLMTEKKEEITLLLRETVK